MISVLAPNNWCWTIEIVERSREIGAFLRLWAGEVGVD
jgi:hypothetical protein